MPHNIVSVARRLYHKGTSWRQKIYPNKYVSVARRLYHKGTIKTVHLILTRILVSVARRLYHKGTKIGNQTFTVENLFQSPAGSTIKEQRFSWTEVSLFSFQSPAGSTIKEQNENQCFAFPSTFMLFY